MECGHPVSFSVAWTGRRKSMMREDLQTGNKSISTCKSLKKILSCIVGDCPHCIDDFHVCFCCWQEQRVTFTDKDVN